MNSAAIESSANPQVRRVRNFDRIGVILSFLCLLHCVFTPVLLALIPVFDWHSTGTRFHTAMAMVLFAVAAFAFIRGFRLHHRKSVLAQGAAGLGLLVAGLFMSNGHQHGAFTTQTYLTIAGSVLLIIAHRNNMRFCRDNCCS